jgi:hypothetical protein
MTETVGFDRRIELAWLDLIASTYAETRDVDKAFRATRSVVELTVGGGSSPHNAAGKTMTVLARIWLRVAPEAERLRDEAAVEIAALQPADRVAVHWAMAALAYPFFRDAAATGGRMLRLQNDFSLSQFKQRLAERWGGRGTTPQAAQRLLHTWASWGALEVLESNGHFGPAPRISVGEQASVYVVWARLLAEPGTPMPVTGLEVQPELFPFDLVNVGRALKDVPNVALHGAGDGLMATAS